MQVVGLLQISALGTLTLPPFPRKATSILFRIITCLHHMQDMVLYCLPYLRGPLLIAALVHLTLKIKELARFWIRWNCRDSSFQTWSLGVLSNCPYFRKPCRNEPKRTESCLSFFSLSGVMPCLHPQPLGQPLCGTKSYSQLGRQEISIGRGCLHSVPGGVFSTKPKIENQDHNPVGAFTPFMCTHRSPGQNIRGQNL